jgi:hypothetical protein
VRLEYFGLRRSVSKFEHARGRAWVVDVIGEFVMGIKTEQALAPLCDLGNRQIAMMGATILGIALASLVLFG